MNISHGGLTELTVKKNVREPVEFSILSQFKNARTTNDVECGENSPNYCPPRNLPERMAVINSNLLKKEKSLVSIPRKGPTKIRSAALPVSLEMWQTLTCLPKSYEIITQLPSNEEKDGNCYEEETSNINIDTNTAVSEFQLCDCEDTGAYSIKITKKKIKSVRFTHAPDCAHKS